MVKVFYFSLGFFFSFFYKIYYLLKVDYNPFFCRLPFYFYIKDGKVIVGNGFSCRRNCSISVNSGELVIGNSVFFNQSVSVNCQYKVIIGDGCIFGEGVKIYDHDHTITPGNGADRGNFSHDSVVFGKNVWVGANVLILKGVTIGENTVIAAGSVVTKSIEPNTTFYQKKLADIKAH